MSFYLYILYSATTDKHYIGQTHNIEERLNRHNRLHEKATRNGAPWILIFTMEFSDRASAMRQERVIKNLKSNLRLKEYIDKMVALGRGCRPS